VDVLKSGAQIGAAAGLDALTALMRAHDAAGGARQGSGAGAQRAEAPTRHAARQVVAEPAADAESFADWMSGVLRREGLTMEAAARQLGVSVKTVSRWVGGATEPRLRDLRRVRELVGEIPFTSARHWTFPCPVPTLGPRRKQ